jgi:hypothetical protein
MSIADWGMHLCSRLPLQCQHMMVCNVTCGLQCELLNSVTVEE